jgi:D-arginine dehydrogenase
VIGPDAEAKSFVWLAGQGGNGVMAGAAAARLAASLARGEGVPADIAVLGITAEAVSPARVRIRTRCERQKRRSFKLSRPGSA